MRFWPDRFLHAARRADAEVLRRARLTVLLAVVLLATAVVYALVYAFVVGYPAGARILGVGAAVVALALPVLRVRPWLRPAGHVLTGVLYGVVVGLMAGEGGLVALATPLLSLVPVVAVLLRGRRSAAGWTAVCVLTIVAFGFAEAHGARFPVLYPAAWSARMRMGSPVALVVCTALLLRVFENLPVEAQDRADVANAALARLAYQDALTGLPNRAHFLAELDRALAAAQSVADAARLAVLLIDLDGFKAVNDTMGHAAGDALLTEIGERLRSATRGAAVVARLGGDEFAVLLDGVRDPADATRVAGRIVTALARPVSLAAGAAHVQGSVGIARATGDARPATILHDADVAMYRAKALGGGRWVWAEHAVGDAAPTASPSDFEVVVVARHELV